MYFKQNKHAIGRQYDKKIKKQCRHFFFSEGEFCYGVNEQFAYNYIFLVASGFFPFFL